jgi:hypothetical protein
MDLVGLRTLCLPLATAIGRHLSNRKTCRLLALLNTDRRQLTGGHLSLPNTIRLPVLLNTDRLPVLLNTGRLPVLLNTDRHLLTGGHLAFPNTVRLPAVLNTDHRPLMDSHQAFPNTVRRRALKGRWLSLLNTDNLLAPPNTGSPLAINMGHHVPKNVQRFPHNATQRRKLFSWQRRLDVLRREGVRHCV